jgi:hypothetical protein
MFDLEKIKTEIESLPNFKYQNQFILQGVKGQTDLNYGVGRSCDLKHKESEFIYPLYDIPYTNSILQELGMYRTRVMCMKPKACYSWHYDFTKRIHIPLQSDWKKCFMVFDGDEVVRMEPNGNYYEVDTTKNHTAVNASNSLRVHIVGLV